MVYETVWIRYFAISFGSTLLSFSTVIAVYLGGLAIGAACADNLRNRLQARQDLWLYSVAEIWIGIYALVIPWLVKVSQQLLVHQYASSAEGSMPIAVSRVLICIAILLPATLPMGATLPWLAAWLAAQGGSAPRLNWIYAFNIVGGAAGAVLAGFVWLPHAGYQGTLATASSLDIGVGVVSFWLARKATARSSSERSRPLHATPVETAPHLTNRALWTLVFFSGWTALLYEVAWSRVAGLLFGPTAATVALTLAVVLLGLGAGSVVACTIRKNAGAWLSGSQCAVAFLLLCASWTVAVSPDWLAQQIRSRSDTAYGLQFLEAKLLVSILFPLTVAAGIALPLAMRLIQRDARSAGGAIGTLYGVNTAGCIVGTLMTGWLLIPYLGIERTLYIGAIINVALCGVSLPWRHSGAAQRIVIAGLALLAFSGLIFPRWDRAAMTAGAYKYAPYYGQIAGNDAVNELHTGEVRFLREGAAGTVTVRGLNNTLALAIDGKVDATDAGGDLLTEKLLAHLPLRLLSGPRNVCVIGLASGVTAGSALTYPLERLDVVEISPEVIEASHLFDRVNGNPLASSRTHLIMNDGRNHLALESRRYDAILSEPSNPWISGMNSMFTREFFQIARRRLNPGGVLAQWFHLYNMPSDDLRSLLRAFVEVFPSATLWQLNDGDVLLTGFADNHPARGVRDLPTAAVADLALAGVTEPDLLLTLYVMRDADLARFAGNAQPNTDDRPILEFHGQRNLHLQTDEENTAALQAFSRQVPPPDDVRTEENQMTPEKWCARGKLFETAESYRLAFQSYRKACANSRERPEALAGMIRCARTPVERAAAGTLETRTEEALAAARVGDDMAAEMILRAVMQAYPNAAESHFNYGLYCLEKSRYGDAIENFTSAIAVENNYLPAFEALAETYLRSHDLRNAAVWSRRILAIDPSHVTARQTLAAIGNR